MKRAPRPRWTEAERDVLRGRYEREGAEACAAVLPGRVPAAVRQQAWKLGLRDPNPPASLRAPLKGQDLKAALAMRDAGASYAAIGRAFGMCEASATNAILVGQCRRGGFKPARRDSTGALILPEIKRMRALMMQGLKNRDIQLQMAVSGACVTHHRRRYEAELRAQRLGKTLPPPGGGRNYSGRKIPAGLKREVERLLLEGHGGPRVSMLTGVSKTHVQRKRRVLIRRLARKGECLPGCDIKGRRHTQKESTRFILPASVERLKAMLIERVPVRRAAKLCAIGQSSAYRIRDELKAEMGARGEALPEPIRPGRVSAQGARERAAEIWLPEGMHYRFRALVKLHGSEQAAKAVLLDQLAAEREAERQRRMAEARPIAFDEQLARVRAGAAVVPVPVIRKAAPDMTLGGIGSAAL